jgi:flagellar biosynthesis protein FliR
MDLEVPAVTLVALLLGTARAAGFVLLAPPFNSRSIPAPVKGALAMALSVMTQNSSVGRLHYLLATTLLFSSGGHLLIVKGFATSYEGMPVGGSVPTEQLGAVFIQVLAMMFLAAVQIAGPMVAVLLLADVALALLSKAAPALNIFSFGFPFKIMLTLLMLGLTFPLLPPALDSLMEHAARAMVSLKSG